MSATALDRVLDELSGAVPTSARPGKVASPEGTRPGALSKAECVERGYVNSDVGEPLPPDVDKLFGATKSYQHYKKEKFEHRLMLWYKLQGFSNREVAAALGYHEITVGQVSRQPWFQEAFCKLAAEMGKSAIQTFLEGEVLPALERTADLARSGESDAVRLAANRELLDRFLGKATVKVESKATLDVTNTTIDAAKLIEEQRLLDQQLKANGLTRHGNS